MVTRDSSLRATDAQRGRGLTQCFEVVAPPLRGRKGLALLRRVVTALENAGVEVNKTCGTHVHHDARDFDLDTFKRLTANYARLQNAVDRVLAPSRRSTVGNQYCKPWTAAEIAQMNRANDVRSLTYVGDRYHVLNLNAYASYGTVEFRQHQGTVNADKIVNWVLFTQGMVRAAKKGIEILTTDSLARVAADLGMKTETVEYFTRRANEFAAA